MAVDKAVIDHVPHKVNNSRNRLPWINRQIKADMKVRKRLYNKAKRSNLQHDWDAYRKTKNSINTKLKEAHNNYTIKDCLITPLVVTDDNFGNTSEPSVKTNLIYLHYS